MASEDIKEALKAAAIQIRDEKQTGANTALRVGSLLLAICEALNFEIEELSKYFLRKDKPDTSQEIITFLKGLLIGENGSGITVLEDGTSQAVVDRLYVKIKAYFDALEVKKKTFVGGEQIISPAGMKCIRVETLDTVYRCYMKAEEEGVEIENEFVVGQLAICQECNIKVGISHHAGNRFYWREVMGGGTDYIDLSKTVCAVDSDVPEAGDDIVGLGHRDDIGRQSAIILSSVAETAPSIIFYQGIDDFTLTGKEVIALEYDRTSGHAKVRIYGDTYIGDKERSSYIEYTQEKGVDIKGSFHIEKGSTGWQNFEGLPEEIQAAASGGSVGAVNLLRNTGFTGDYESEPMSGDMSLSVDSELYSRALKHWTGIASISADSASASGRSAVVGSLSQSVMLIEGENYVISFKAKGKSVAVSCGDYSETQLLTAAYERYTFSFTHHGSGVFLLSGTATVCELQLERGSVRTDWKPSILDSDKAMAEFQSLKYLQDAIRNGSVDLLGGLVLSNMIQLGNYRDGKMQQVNAGISGIYNDGDDVAFWGGGTFEQAIHTVMKFKENPNYTPSNLEWKNLANFVVTHGGDVFLRGYIYALGGFFRGEIHAESGILSNIKSSNGSFEIDNEGNVKIIGKFETSILENRIVIGPATNSLKMFDDKEHETLSLSFENGGENWDYGVIELNRYRDDSNLVWQKIHINPSRILINDLVYGTSAYHYSNQSTFYGKEGELLRVGMTPVYDGLNLAGHLASVFSDSWKTLDKAIVGEICTDKYLCEEDSTTPYARALVVKC